jgi:hypothetical protein
VIPLPGWLPHLQFILSLFSIASVGFWEGKLSLARRFWWSCLLAPPCVLALDLSCPLDWSVYVLFSLVKLACHAGWLAGWPPPLLWCALSSGCSGLVCFALVVSFALLRIAKSKRVLPLFPVFEQVSPFSTACMASWKPTAQLRFGGEVAGRGNQQLETRGCFDFPARIRYGGFVSDSMAPLCCCCWQLRGVEPEGQSVCFFFLCAPFFLIV